MKLQTKLNIFVFSIVILGLSACGGGGGGGSTSTPANASVFFVISSSTLNTSSAASSSSIASSSSVISTSSSVSIFPLPTGSGTLSTRFVLRGTYSINETTGALTLLTNSLEKNYRAADIDPDGYVIAVGSTDMNIDKIDLISGETATLFNAPENISALAVSPDNTIVGISSEQEFGKKNIYRFSNTGVVLSKVASANVNPTGIDFDKDGNLYGIDLSGTWQINPITGESTSKFLLNPSGQNDIDIDNQGRLRVISFNQLQIFDIVDGSKISDITLQDDYFSFSPLVHQPTSSSSVSSSIASVSSINSSSSIASSSSVSSVSITNTIPNANAGINQSVNLNAVVNLDGSQSTDMDSDGLSYLWTFVSKPIDSLAILDNATVMTPTFRADTPGSYVLSLIVNDGLVNSASDNVQIDVLQPAVTLYQKQEDFFGGGAFTSVSFPYSSASSVQVSVSGIPTPTTYKLATFKLKAQGKNFTISNVSATDTTANVMPYFSGISESLVITDGAEVQFNLICPLTKGATTNLSFSFKILETDQIFSSSYTFKSN